MRIIEIRLVVLLLSLLLLQSCTDVLSVLTGFKPGEIKNDLQTPEPGTLLTPRSKLILKNINKYAANPDSAFDSKSKLLDILKPWVRFVEDRKINAGSHDIPVRIYCNKPKHLRNDLPVILFYHGGGFIWGSIDIFDTYSRKLAQETGTVFIAVGYRLAPEYPFPAAVHDSYTVLKWAEENIHSYGGDPDKLIVMGESAGGNLAAVMPLVSSDSSGPDIYAQIISCGATTFTDTVFQSRQYFLSEGRSFLVSEDYLYRCMSAYLTDSAYVNHRYISPLYAELNEDMPPAMVITAQCDPLRDEGRAYAEKMKKQGIDVEYHEYEGMIHAFMNFFPILPEARQAIHDVDAFIDSLN